MSEKHDPANYRAMSEPFENPEIANEIVEKFFEMVKEARQVCKIKDVHILIKFHVMNNDKEVVAMTSGHMGNTIEGLNMCAWGIKQELENQNLSIKDFLEK